MKDGHIRWEIGRWNFLLIVHQLQYFKDDFFMQNNISIANNLPILSNHNRRGEQS